MIMKKSNVFLLLVLTVIFGLFLRLFFFTKVVSGDDLEYYNFAYQIIQHTFKHDASFHSPRIGLTYPTALFYNLFGINEITSNLLPLLASALSIILIFYLGKIMFNEKIGLTASFLLSFFPLNVFYSTTLFPDLSSAFFMALSVYLFLKADKNKSNLNYLLAGLCVGFGYLMKELSALILIFFVIYIIHKKSFKKAHLLVPLGFLMIFVFELSYYAIKTSNPLFRYTIVSGQATNIMKAYYPNYFGINALSRLFLHYPYLVFTDTLTVFFYIFILIALIYCVARKKRETYTILFWILPIALYVNFGSLSFSQYVPLPAGVRYLEIITIPSILLMSFFFYENRNFLNKFFLPAILIFLFVTSIYFIATNEQRNSTENLYKASSFMKTAPKRIIYTDPRSAEILKYLFNFERNEFVESYNKYDALEFNKDRNNLADLKNIHDAYVVVNWRMINALLTNYKGMKLPPEVKEIPKNWQEKFSYGKGNSRLIIYYVS